MTCTDSLEATVSDTCAWHDANRSDKLAMLADLLLYGSTGVSFVSGWRFAR